MQDDARIVLAQLLRDHGRELAEDPRRLKAMLADTLPGTADAKRLVAAAEEGIPGQLLAAGGDDTGTLRLQLIHRLEEERDMTAQAAAWTVDAWAAALEVPVRVTGPVVGPVGPGDETRTVPVPPDPSEEPPPARPPWRVAAIAAGAVVLAAAAFLLLAVLRPSDPGTADATFTPTPSASAEASADATPSATPMDSTPAPTPTPTPGGFTAQEEELLRWIPSNTADSCASADHPNIGQPLAQLDCRVSGMNGTVYVLYRNPQAMRQQYEDFSRGPRDSGSCAQGNLPSEHVWQFEGGDPQGRYSCFRSEGTVWVVWTANYANILSWGYRHDGRSDRLYEAWLSGDSGPRTSPQ